MSIKVIILPTNIAKPKVLSIQALLNNNVNSKKVASKDGKTLKSLRIKTPNSIPLKSDSNTLLVYKARIIARRDGRRERTEVSMTKTQKLKVLDQLFQIFLYRAHIFYV